MKRILPILISLGIAQFVCAQTVTLDFTIGVLSISGGSTAISDGSLLQVIASPDATFADPTSTAFTGGNDVLVFSKAFDSLTSGQSGAMLFTQQVSLSTSAIAGYDLMIRWFPTLTTSSTAPGDGTSYGEYGFNQDNTWVAPSAGNTLSYSLVTLSFGGSLANTVGSAMLSTPAVPEPSTYAQFALGLGALGLIAYRRRKVA